jgi:exopolyphosphatase/guanosine-5'-triphosphate,3'-diphosphate pyrophosphatase
MIAPTAITGAEPHVAAAGTFPAGQPASRPVAVIDIGSNSVRLVAFESLSRAPPTVFNEKVLCGLGRGLSETGHLHADGRMLAIETLVRFAALAKAMNAEIVDVVATAAVREASDGGEFVAQAAAAAGLRVRVVAGVEEARLSAIGVGSAIPGADGLMGDLGGGSLELVRLDSGHPAEQATLPLGTLHIRSLSSSESVAAIDRQLSSVDWAGQGRGRPFFAVGGAWRALARLHMAQRYYPLRVIHHYQVARRGAEELVQLVAHAGPKAIGRIDGVSAKRMETVPSSSLALERILRIVEPSEVIFCSYGLREGLLYEHLDAAEQRKDPFLEAARETANRSGRFSLHAEEIDRWIAPLFADADAGHARLRFATCLLSDLAWRAHSDFRAEQALNMVLQAPFVGLDHPGRAFVALAVFARYRGDTNNRAAAVASRLMSEEAAADALVLGRALDLAHTVSGGAPGLLTSMPLSLADGKIRLSVSDDHRSLDGEMVEKRLKALARALDVTIAGSDLA